MATAVGKRVKISKVQQQMMLAVLGVSLVVGASAVLISYLIKTVSFNGEIIGAKDGSINEFYAAIKNVGVCIDENGDGKYTDAELDACDPESIDVSTLDPSTLRYNVMINMANNNALESVAREGLSDCYKKGKRIDFAEAYQKAETDEEKATNLSMLKKCSALRVIPDALPAQQNEEALLSSLNSIFIMSNWEPESLSPSGSGESDEGMDGLGVIPVSLSIEANTAKTHQVLANIERSIREFDIKAAKISWNGSGEGGAATLELQGQADAYYTGQKEIVLESKTLYASPDARKAARGDDSSSEGETE